MRSISCLGGTYSETEASELVETLARQESRKLSETKILNAVRISCMEELTLLDYVVAKEIQCQKYHNNCTLHCSSFVNVGITVLEQQFVSLPYLWNKYFSTTYDCEKAQRKLLQMPLVSINVNDKVFVVEKEHDCTDYESKRKIISTAICNDGSYRKKPDFISKKEYEHILSVAETEPEKLLVKHTLCSSYNLSKRQASNLYAISELAKRAEKVKDAAKIVRNIKYMHKNAMKQEQQEYLRSRGVDPSVFLHDTSTSESDCSTDSETDYSSESESENETPESEIVSIEDKRTKKAIDIDINSTFVLDMLQETSFNWFAFSASLETVFRNRRYDSSVLDQFLCEFASRLPELGLKDDELELLEQSRLAYLATLEQKEDLDTLPTLSDSSDEEKESDVEELELVTNNQNIKKGLQKIQDKHRKRTKINIQMNRLLRKKITRSSKTILHKYPDIGDVIERIVEESDIGADRWRRTGVYTFSGDTKKSKRMTFSKIQNKLEEHYGRSFSFGTVVQLCVPRNKRRLSSKRYKSAANVKHQRAWKGFSLKFNPDCKWSRSLYKLFKQLQKDGNHMVLLNRDDQAGFRLDSTYTHKNTATLSIKPTVTTRTDFLSKCPAQLQTTSYNFPKTETTSDICIGVVKASKLHEKSPSQHADDMVTVEALSIAKPTFFKNDLENPKDIECIQVDGAGDEGPTHLEVQFLWTERHLCKPTRITMVTTRCSGDSFLNRVELQNGSLSKGHANMFIPSTLCGSHYKGNGVDTDKFNENMSAAIKQYVTRVYGTPCMKTVIHLVKGPEMGTHTSRREKLLTFLKGSKKAKKDLKKDSPTLYKYFSEVWDTRNNHIDDSLPQKYVFLLKCCGRSGCPHPLCCEGINIFGLLHYEFGPF